MITEDYVSFETAKLLKEKGFDERCRFVYMPDGTLVAAPNFMEGESSVDNSDIERVSNYNGWKDFAVLRPSLQVAMKWLREVHNLHCDIAYDDLDWFWNIISVSNCVPVEDRPKLLKDGFAGMATYEEACEAAIRYCLENLI